MHVKYLPFIAHYCKRCYYICVNNRSRPFSCPLAVLSSVDSQQPVNDQSWNSHFFASLLYFHTVKKRYQIQTYCFETRPKCNSLNSIFEFLQSSSFNYFLRSPVVAWELRRNIGDLDVMSTADVSGGSDGSGGEMKLLQLKRSGGADRRVLTRRASAIRQAGGELEDVQATLEFLIDRRNLLTELDSQVQKLIEDDDELVADVEEAVDVFMAAERAVKWCQGKIKDLQPPSPSGADETSSGSLTKLNLPSLSGEKTQWVSFWDQFTTLVDSKVDMANGEKLSFLKLSLKGDAAYIVSSLLVADASYEKEAYSSTFEHSASCQMNECSGSHSISQCERYKQLGTRKRTAVVRKLKLCMNCLGRHFVTDCPSKSSCRTCNGRPHTSLHFDRPVEQQGEVTSSATFSCPSELLSTAMVGIDDTAGKTLMSRALLDSGLQTSFITADAASKLNLARSTFDVKISGIGRQAAKESVCLLVGLQTFPVTALVPNLIAGNIPSQPINLKQLKSMKSVSLADKNFHQRGPVKLLLGANVYEDLSLDERRKDQGRHYRKSTFGCVVTGVFVPCACLPMSILSSFSRTGTCSLLGSRRDSSSEADVERKSSMCGTLQHNDLRSRWRTHRCSSTVQAWDTSSKQLSNRQAEIVRFGTKTQRSRWCDAAVTWTHQGVCRHLSLGKNSSNFKLMLLLTPSLCVQR